MHDWLFKDIYVVKLEALAMPAKSFTYYWLLFYINIVHTKFNKKLQSPGALNIQETPGYKQRENVKKANVNK